MIDSGESAYNRARFMRKQTALRTALRHRATRLARHSSRVYSRAVKGLCDGESHIGQLDLPFSIAILSLSN
jgi:hypothetical protein